MAWSFFKIWIFGSKQLRNFSLKIVVETCSIFNHMRLFEAKIRECGVKRKLLPFSLSGKIFQRYLWRNFYSVAMGYFDTLKEPRGGLNIEILVKRRNFILYDKLHWFKRRLARIYWSRGSVPLSFDVARDSQNRTHLSFGAAWASWIPIWQIWY